MMKYLYEAIILALKYILCQGKISDYDYDKCEKLYNEINDEYYSKYDDSFS